MEKEKKRWKYFEIVMALRNLVAKIFQRNISQIPQNEVSHQMRCMSVRGNFIKEAFLKIPYSPKNNLCIFENIFSTQKILQERGCNQFQWTI